jgi:hypothetical protein
MERYTGRIEYRQRRILDYFLVIFSIGRCTVGDSTGFDKRRDKKYFSKPDQRIIFPRADIFLKVHRLHGNRLLTWRVA